VVSGLVALALWLVAAGRSFFIQSVVLHDGNERVKEFDTVQQMLSSYWFLAIRFALFLPLLIVWAISPRRAEFFKKSVCNMNALFGGASIILFAVSIWSCSSLMNRVLDHDIWAAEIGSAFFVLAVLSLFFPAERISASSFIISLCCGVATSLSFWNADQYLTMDSNVGSLILYCLAWSVAPALYIFFLRRSVLHAGTSKTLVGQAVVVVLFSSPFMIVYENRLWSDAAAVLSVGTWWKLVGAVLIDFLLLVVLAAFACLFSLSLILYYLQIVLVTTSSLVLVASVMWDAYAWNIFHLCGLLLTGIVVLYFVAESRAYLKHRNRFL